MPYGINKREEESRRLVATRNFFVATLLRMTTWGREPYAIPSRVENTTQTGDVGSREAINLSRGQSRRQSL